MTHTALMTEHPAAGRRLDFAVLLPLVLTAAAFLVVFAKPMLLLGRDWWNDPEAGHGLLLAPAAVWLAWKRGLVDRPAAQPFLGVLLVVLACLIRVGAELAAELFTMRGAIFLALAGLVTFCFGFRQVLAWWLPFLLLGLSIPLPELIRSGLALPLQFRASEMGAALLEWRNIPVRLTGNIIEIPGQRLFVTEACSGLRSLTALLSLAVLIGGIWLQHPLSRVALLVVAVPIAVMINGIRVFMTGFLVYFVDPKLGQGFMHLTEGWLLFVVSFALVGAAAWVIGVLDRLWATRRRHA